MNAPPDGYTLLLVGASSAINATLYEKLSFNFLRDIAPVSGIISIPFIMAVNPSFPAKTVSEFIAYARANPGKVNMASGGNGMQLRVIGTPVERTTRFTMLLHLPRMTGHGQEARIENGPALAGHGAEAVCEAIMRTITTLPEQLRRSLTWDQGAEMAQHARLKIDAGVQVYFCDPHSPWQRATKAAGNTDNGLLRQYFPKGHGVEAWALVAALGAANPLVPVDRDDFMARACRHLAQRALLVLGRLFVRRHNR